MHPLVHGVKLPFGWKYAAVSSEHVQGVSRRKETASCCLLLCTFSLIMLSWLLYEAVRLNSDAHLGSQAEPPWSLGQVTRSL